MNAPVAEQSTLLDLNGQEFNSMWVDENQPLFIANNPLHWKAHKLQVALARMEKQQEKNPAQFNSTTYLAMLNQYTEVMQEIKDQQKVAAANEILDAARVVESGNGSAEATVGEGVASSMDSGISADNPLSR